MNTIIKHKAEGYRKVIIYGAGVYGRRCFFDLTGCDVEILLAVTEQENEQQFHGIKVQKIESLLQYREEALIIIAVSSKYRAEMEHYAVELGFKNIFLPEINLHDYDYLIQQRNLDIKRELMQWYEVYTGEELHIDNPKTFNEKIQWLKVHDSTPVKGELADKYLVRNYVKNMIGEQHLISMLGIWDKFDEIDFDRLPEKFVLKCTHGSGMNKIVRSKSKINYPEFKRQFEQWLAINYAYQCGLEMHYQYIVPKIIAEEYLQTEDDSDLRDYKVHVFNGKAKLIQVDIDRQHIHRRNLYTTEWEYIPYSILYPTAPDVVIHKPDCLGELIRLSELLAKGFIYVRVDFYIVKEHIYFGEMTFTHGSGIEKFTPESFNREMGEWIHLPDIGRKQN